jgi:hypothetical protein
MNRSNTPRAAGAASMQIVPGFAVPFVEVRHPDSVSLNAALRALFIDREGQGGAYRNPNPTMNIRDQLFESRFDLFKWPEPSVQTLRDFCFSALFRAVAELSGYDANRMRTLDVRADAWFHITRKGGYFGQHNHPMASWSGVYCVDPGDDRSGHPDSGALVFAHPIPAASAFVDLASVNLRDPWGIRPRTYHLQPGQLVLFPSWAIHQVMPYPGEGERITVAFNAWFRAQDVNG